MFLDETVIRVTSGRGGDGVVHFRREKYVPFGGPDGGDGGKGADVYLEAKNNLNTLSAFRHQPVFSAPSGGNGAKQNMTGRSGADLTVWVPTGTVVYDAAKGETLGDLTQAGQRLLVARGGRGGRGNIHFANSRNHTPRIAERGEPGETRELRLELKLIADIGIVGAPNAGKSTLLASVTHATPKIAPYPFTTLEPNLGVVELDDETTLVMADIPGLIEGAHLGYGLGHDFLRHIQRTRVLIHVLDGMADDPILDLAQINSELALFDPDLAKKPQVVALNKMDLPEVAERWPAIQKGLNARKYESVAISAVTGNNVRQLLYRAAELIDHTPAPQDVSSMPVYRVESDPRQFTIQRDASGWRVAGASIERAAAMTYWEHEESVRRFQKILATLGIEEALRKAGAQSGDTVFIADYELEWEE